MPFSVEWQALVRFYKVMVTHLHILILALDELDVIPSSDLELPGEDSLLFDVPTTQVCTVPNILRSSS